MSTEERDQLIAKRYEAGVSAPRIGLEFNLSVPQVRRIVAESGVKRDPDAPPLEVDKVIDPAHKKLGHRLYSHRFLRVHDANKAASTLGWSVKKLRSIEQGHSQITLVDLQAIAQYMNKTISELTENL